MHVGGRVVAQTSAEGRVCGGRPRRCSWLAMMGSGKKKGGGAWKDDRGGVGRIETFDPPSTCEGGGRQRGLLAFGTSREKNRPLSGGGAYHLGGRNSFHSLQVQPTFKTRNSFAPILFKFHMLYNFLVSIHRSWAAVCLSMCWCRRSTEAKSVVRQPQN